jgi:hypothetical protein
MVDKDGRPKMPSTNEWQQILDRLRPPVVNKQTFETWLTNTRFRGAQNGTLYVSVPSDDWVSLLTTDDKLASKIAQAQSSLGIRKQIVYEPEQHPLGTTRSSVIGALASQITPQTVSWLWPRFLPLGKLTILEGDPGLGKSTLAIDISARVSSGGSMPDGTCTTCRRRGSVIITAEDGLHDTVVPRLRAAGACLELVRLVDVIREPQSGARIPSVLTDLPKIREAIKSCRASLVVFDPLVAFVPMSVNTWQDQAVRQVLQPLAWLAEQERVSVICIRHLSKRIGGPAIYRGGGSIGFAGAARAVLLVGPDPENPDSGRVLITVKNNLSPFAKALRFKIEGRDGAPRVRWRGESKATAQALLAAYDLGDERSSRDEAKRFLQIVLGNGPQPGNEILREAHEAGIPERTLRRAKHELKIKSKKVGGVWKWYPQRGQGCQFFIFGSLDRPDSLGTAAAAPTQKTMIASETVPLKHRVSRYAAVIAADMRREFESEMRRDPKTLTRMFLAALRQEIRLQPGRPRNAEITRAHDMRDQGKSWREIYELLISPDLPPSGRTLAKTRLRDSVRQRKRRDEGRTIRITI